MRTTLGVAVVLAARTWVITGEYVDFVPLTKEWGRDGALSVVLSVLEDAGFHPAIDCDPRGWMHFYGWPFGAQDRITVWIPHLEHMDALAFLAAGCEPSWSEVEEGDSFAGLVLINRRWLYIAWLFEVISFAAVLTGIQALAHALTRHDSDDAVE
jgi:hypothetical protein